MTSSLLVTAGSLCITASTSVFRSLQISGILDMKMSVLPLSDRPMIMDSTHSLSDSGLLSPNIPGNAILFMNFISRLRVSSMTLLEQSGGQVSFASVRKQGHDGFAIILRLFRNR